MVGKFQRALNIAFVVSYFLTLTSYMIASGGLTPFLSGFGVDADWQAREARATREMAGGLGDQHLVLGHQGLHRRQLVNLLIAHGEAPSAKARRAR